MDPQKRIAEISVRLKVIDGELNTLDEAAKKNAGGVFTAEQLASYKTFTAEAKKLVEEKKGLEEQVALQLERRTIQEAAVIVPVKEKRIVDGGGRPAGEGLTIIEGNEGVARRWTRTARPKWMQEPTRTKLKVFRGRQGGMVATERAFRFGMWQRAVLSITNPRFRSRRAEKFADKEWGEEWFDDAKAGVSKDAAAHGETDAFGSEILVPEEFANDLIRYVLNYGVARRIFRVRPMRRDTLRLSRSGEELTASFVGENAPIPEDNVTFGDFTLVLKKIAVIARWSNELDEDAIIDMGDYIAQAIARSFIKLEDQSCFLGDGTSTYGNIVGLLNRLLDVAGDGTGTVSAGVVTQAAGNTVAALTLTDFIKVGGALPDYAELDDRFSWVMHRQFYHNVIIPLLVAGGNPTIQNLTGDRPRYMLNGYPVVFSNLYPATPTAGTIAATFGDHSKAGTMGTGRGVTIDFSEHAVVNGESVWQRDQIACRGTERFTFEAHDVGDGTNAGPITALRMGA